LLLLLVCARWPLQLQLYLVHLITLRGTSSISMATRLMASYQFAR